MNKMLALLLTLSFLSSGAQAQGFKSPDILINTKLKADWSGLFVNKIRRLLGNYGYGDPFRQKFDQPVVVYEAKVDHYLNHSGRKLLSDLSKLLGTDFLVAQTQVVVHGLRYDIRGFKTDLKVDEETKDGVTIAADFSASKVKISADKVILSLVIPGMKSVPVIHIEVQQPAITASEESLVKFFSRIKMKAEPDKYLLQLVEADFQDMSQGILNNNSVDLSFSRVIVPKVSVRIGNKELKFDQKKIEDLIFSKKEGIKSLLLAQFSSLLASGFNDNSFKAMENIGFSKVHWIDTVDVQTRLNIKSFKSFSDKEHVLAQLDGDFCTNDTFKRLKEDCVNARVTKVPQTRIKADNHHASLDIMRDLVDEGNANIVVSISEDYVNRLLATTMDAGLWDDKLKEAGVIMGSNKPFIRLDNKGSQYGTLYLDMIYPVKSMERLALGAKEVRFILAMKVGLKIRHDNRIPVFAINIAEIDTSDDTLIYGKPELGLVSGIQKLRFKKKVLEKVRAQLKDIPFTEVLSLAYKPLRGMDLDKVDFVSDGQGRMNALILLKSDEEFEKTN